jgi:hypothetical protein
MYSRETIENFLKGYSKEELEKIRKDLKIVQEVTYDMVKPNKASDRPVYLATAGGPGSAKTTTIETFLRENKLDNYVYADPDQVSLKNMIFTYRKSLTNFDFAIAKSNHMALKNAYDKWRGASNYICHEMLQIAFGNKDRTEARYSVAHGTTSTSPHIASLYQNVKDFDYRIVLLLCYSQDETRKQAVARREKEQGFVQTDPNEVISKGSDFPKRFDIYFSYADEIHFYWNDELSHGKLPTPCAKLITTSNSSNLSILNEADWINFCRKYLQDIQKYNIEICKTFAPLIPKSLLDIKKAVATSALQESSLYSAGENINSNVITKLHSGKLSLWSFGNSNQTVGQKVEVRPNSVYRP